MTKKVELAWGLSATGFAACGMVRILGGGELDVVSLLRGLIGLRVQCTVCLSVFDLP